MANLIDLYRTGGDLIKAKEIAERALSLWPANATLLMAAYTAATRRDDRSAKVNYLERILQIEPDNVAMQQARVELKQLDGGSLDSG
jgi:tetratricopeptide (TPR) repeat protein